MKIILITTCVTLTINLFGQTNVEPRLKSLVDAEWAFINTAKEKNTRDAFIESLADNAVTFGQEIQKGKDYLTAQQPNESWLYWEPVYSVIAASGDFGFNTGPWEFRQKRSDEKAIAYGQFVSVWKKINGAWKVAIDIGISHGAPTNKETWKTSSLASTSSKGSIEKNALIGIDNHFQSQLANHVEDTYRKFLSSEARLYRQKQEPMTNSTMVEKYLSSQPPKTTFSIIDGEISSTGDLAYVYGTAVVHENVDRSSFFIRIWRKEDQNWKIVLDLIN
jgi:ketosteroid isomerase-like protein